MSISATVAAFIAAYVVGAASAASFRAWKRWPQRFKWWLFGGQMGAFAVAPAGVTEFGMNKLVTTVAVIGATLVVFLVPRLVDWLRYGPYRPHENPWWPRKVRIWIARLLHGRPYLGRWHSS